MLNQGNNKPFISQAGESLGARPIYYSKPENAILIPKSLAPGFGMLRAGTLLAEISASGSPNVGMLVPYIPSTDPARVDAGGILGKSFLVVDYASAATVCYVKMEDSYRFVVGDDLMLMRNNGGSPAYIAGGAISAIDRTTDVSRAKITFTSGTADANFTVANKTCAYPAAGVTTKFNKAVFILDQDVDTGYGAEAVGANASVILGNAAVMLPYLLMQNYDAQAHTDLAGKVSGNIYYIA